MSRISSMAKLDKGLVVKGTGYASPIQTASTSAAAIAVVRRKNLSGPLRRAGSLGNVAPNGTAKNNNAKSRVPFLPAGANRPQCGPKTCTNARSRGQTAATSSQQSIICKCQHPADISFLENIYVQNLQTQIEVLEMENNYLRTSGLVDDKTSQHEIRRPKSILVRAEERLQQPSTKEHHSTTDSVVSHGVYEESDSNGNGSAIHQQQMHFGHDRFYDQPGTSSSSIWSKSNSIELYESRLDEDQGYRAQGFAPARKRVEFADEIDDEIRAQPPKPGPTIVGAKQNGREGNGNGTIDAAAPPQIHFAFRDQSTQQRFLDEDLFVKLEQAFQKEIKLEEKLKAQMTENKNLRSERDQLETQLRNWEGKFNREHRSLMEDNVELQRRLDKLTPLLAEREAKLLRAEEESERNDARLRQAEMRTASLQAKLEEQKREDTLMSELDSDRQAELERLREKLRKLDATLQSANERESAAMCEIKLLKQTLHERERAESQIEQRAEKLEKLVQTQEKEILNQKHNANAERQLHESKRIEHNLRTEIRRFEEELMREKEANKTLKHQQREWAASEEKHRDARHRMMKELEALQALSNSLTSENKGLREERIAVDERIQILQNKVFAKERDVEDLTDRLEEFKRKYTEAINRLSAEIARQNETSEELEEIVKRVHELSNSIPRRIASPSSFSPIVLSPSPVTSQPMRQNSAGKGDREAIVVAFPPASPSKSVKRDFVRDSFESDKIQGPSSQQIPRDSDKSKVDNHSKPKMKLSQLKQQRRDNTFSNHPSVSSPSHSEMGPINVLGTRTLRGSRRMDSQTGTDNSDDQNSENSQHRSASKTRRKLSLVQQLETEDTQRQSQHTTDQRRTRRMRSLEIGSSATRNFNKDTDEISSSNTSVLTTELRSGASGARAAGSRHRDDGDVDASTHTTSASTPPPPASALSQAQSKKDDSLSQRYRKKIS